MTEPVADRIAELRHALANPLSALIAEVQLTLMSAQDFDDEARQSLQDIETLALRMRTIMHDSRAADATPTRSTVEENS